MATKSTTQTIPAEPTGRRTLPGKLTITRSSSNLDPDRITIQLIDEASGWPVTEIEVSPEMLALCLTGASRQPCSFEWDASAPIGLKREVKHEAVFVPGKSYDRHPKAARIAIAQYEVDGWRGDDSDAGNHHKWIDHLAHDGQEGGWYRVGFVRFVDPETGEPRP